MTFVAADHDLAPANLTGAGIAANGMTANALSGLNLMMPNLAEAMKPLLNALNGLNLMMPNLAEAMKPLLAPAGAGIAANALSGLNPMMPNLAEAMKPLLGPVWAGVAIKAIHDIAQATPESTSVTENHPVLSHEQIRWLFGAYVYALVMSLMVFLYLAITMQGKVSSEILTLFVFATGIGGHKVALKVRRYALDVYDGTFPPE